MTLTQRLLRCVAAAFLCAGLAGACSNSSSTEVISASSDAGDFLWNIPDGIPLPIVPSENPVNELKFELGRRLFYDKRLSGNGSMSCSGCHEQSRAFTDGKKVALGSTGEAHPRGSQALVNVAYNSTLTWANPTLLSLERQILVPLFGETPVEHGLTDANWPEAKRQLEKEPVYQRLFPKAFPGEAAFFSKDQIVKALATFVRGLNSFGSPYDRFLAGDDTALGEKETRGKALFFGERLECFHCHGGYNFSDSTADRTMTFINRPFHNTGLFNIAASGAYPAPNRGVFEITGTPSDMGRFRAPTLRNISKTSPYMHDGSVASLGEVVEFYAAGGRNIASGPEQGDGRKNPYKDGFVTGFSLLPSEKQDLIAFLESLTDEGFLRNPRFSNPW
ncbi:MAG: di-heme enzyme [Silvanigrellales bacterium]|nr:di-heme enzyme [Silvanigrellales bacterium]